MAEFEFKVRVNGRVGGVIYIDGVNVIRCQFVVIDCYVFCKFIIDIDVIIEIDYYVVYEVERVFFFNG